MASRDDGLWDRVSLLLGSRPGWSLESQTTPGSARIWCFGRGGVSELSVSVTEGDVSVYMVQWDEEITLPDAGGLAAWLDENQVLFARGQSLPDAAFDELMSRAIDEWRRRGL